LPIGRLGVEGSPGGALGRRKWRRLRRWRAVVDGGGAPVVLSLREGDDEVRRDAAEAMGATTWSMASSGSAGMRTEAAIAPARFSRGRARRFTA